MASCNPQRPPDQLKSTLPLNSRGGFPIPPCTPYSRMQEWCRYGIKYHYAPFFLRNPMVTFSGPNCIIPNQGPKIHYQFLKEDSSAHQSGKSMAAIRRQFQDPNHLALQELGWQFFQDYSKGHSQRLFIIKSAVKAASTSILLGQLNWFIQEAINQPVCPWPNSNSTVGI
ncbi:hypothetical protein O181_061758 [Austropuccinia psidii MF-1]|uniref:Uncharacterized protein n=1 Tax=Austropuccinia psidii MF-1 TaxID=1389203 RepID=A0A9Q3ENG8_9BASI|nr:hypothetical protein [Austropuccinia psidii MF-1]